MHIGFCAIMCFACGIISLKGKLMRFLLLTSIVVFVAGCAKTQMTAVAIGCAPEEITFHDEKFWAEYWEARCQNKRYACRGTTNIPLFQTWNAKCTEIVVP